MDWMTGVLIMATLAIAGRLLLPAQRSPEASGGSKLTTLAPRLTRLGAGVQLLALIAWMTLIMIELSHPAMAMSGAADPWRYAIGAVAVAGALAMVAGEVARLRTCRHGMAAATDAISVAAAAYVAAFVLAY